MPDVVVALVVVVVPDVDVVVEGNVEVGVVVVAVGRELVIIAKPQPCAGSLSVSGSDTSD
ncbi:MAG TPA: hypothetical protein VNF05_06840 [Acidimicrobiales bacterium]|nr:hypothetical protein [Acidimicrobiales bacterium]